MSLSRKNKQVLVGNGITSTEMMIVSGSGAAYSVFRNAAAREPLTPAFLTIASQYESLVVCPCPRIVSQQTKHYTRRRGKKDRGSIARPGMQRHAWSQRRGAVESAPVLFRQTSHFRAGRMEMNRDPSGRTGAEGHRGSRTRVKGGRQTPLTTRGMNGG